MATGKNSGAYIFLGPEIGKKQDEVDKIRKKLAGGKNAVLEETVFYAGETSAAQIADMVLNRSLFADCHLFIIKSAEQIKKKEDIALIESCINCGDSTAGSVLLFLSDENKLAAGLEDLVPRENKIIFYEMLEDQKEEWVSSLFRREGRSIGQDGIDAILELVENNTDALRRECSRLMLFLPSAPDRPIRAQDVEQWLSHSREESAFTLFSRIAAGDLPRAIESLHTLLAAKESAPGILAGLAWCFRKLRSYLALVESGGASNNFELKKIGLSSPKARDDYTAAARRYNMTAADACLALTAEYDISTRAFGSAFEQILMDVYIIKIMNR